MNKKTKVVSATLSTVTALSSAAVLTQAPLGAVKNVQALDDNTAETTKQNQPTNKNNLEKEVEQKNSDVISAGAALQGAEFQKNGAEESLNNAKTNKKENDEKLTTSQTHVDQTLAKEVKDRAQTVLQLQETLASQKQQKDVLDQAVEEKQNQLKTAQDQYNKAQADYNDLADKNKDTLDKLTQAENTKATYEKELTELNDHLTALNQDIETVTTKLNDETKTLNDNKSQLVQLTTEKQNLETQLKASTDKLNTLKDALNKQPTTEEVTQLQKDIDILEKDIDTKTSQLSSLDQEMNSLTASIETQKATVNETTKKKDDLTKQYDALTTQVTEAKTNLDSAKTSYDAAKKAMDDLNNNVDTPELAQLKAELNNLQMQQTALQAQVDATTSKLKAAETELANAYTKYDNNVVNFYKEVYNNTGDLDAYYAYTELEKYDGKTVGSATIYDSKNYDKTIASLSDLQEALNYIKMCNQIRAYEGAAPLKVSYYLMVVSAIQNEYTSVKWGHSQIYEVAENIYGSTRDYNSTDFLDQNGNLDVAYLDQLGRDQNLDVFSTQRQNPFYGWWIKEKVKYEKTNDPNVAGHYFNIIDKNYTLTGFSHNNQLHNSGYYTWGQVFAESLVANKLDGSGKVQITGQSVDDFEKTLNAWILKKANGVQIEQDKVDAAKAESEKATNALNDNKKKITAKQTEINNYKDNVNTQFKAAETTYNNAKSTYDNLASQQSSVKAELDSTSTAFNSQKDALNKLEDQLKDDQQKKDTLSQQLTEEKTLLAQKKEELSNATKDKAELEQAIKDANADVDRLTALIDENDKKIKVTQSAISTNEQNINAYTAQLNTLNSEITSKEAEKNVLSANIDALNTAIDAYNKQLKECNKAKKALDVAKNNLDSAQAEYDQALKAQTAAGDVITDTSKKLDDANESLEKAQRATADWEGIKAGTVDHYAPYHDEVLDGLLDTVLVYVSAKDAAPSIETKLADAQKDYDEKAKNYEDALNAYNVTLNEYTDAKANLDAFNAKYGVVSNDTIILPSEVTYTGQPIKPEVIVKDSKGNVVDSSEYTLTYGDNTEVGEGTVTIKLNNDNYVGKFTKTFKIVSASTGKDDVTTPPTDKKNETTTPSDKKDKVTVTPSTKDETAVKSDQTSTTVKTGDSSPIVQLSLFSILSMLFYTLLRRKENKD
ncbi:CAP domain-containing protein [uncultured Catenibacterium sp.]|uniref:CAP domain-containing protein n=1 Tax=uncultured Catenibacterium sp. TaxID=286142 RepID=UPI0025E12535|nr:CAP domain-containing protein [uncultured Catenibacterium sp.]